MCHYYYVTMCHYYYHYRYSAAERLGQTDRQSHTDALHTNDNNNNNNSEKFIERTPPPYAELYALNNQWI